MRADGTRFAAEITTTPVHEHGRHTGYLACVRDVTERKEAERVVLDRTKQFAALARVTRAVGQAGPEEARKVLRHGARSVDATTRRSGRPTATATSTTRDARRALRPTS